MSDSEQPAEQSGQDGANTSAQDAMVTQAMAAPLLPNGLKFPQEMKTDGNLATNWKKFKRGWENYAIMARLTRFEEEFKTATFLSVIGQEAMEFYEGMVFTPETRTATS